MSAEVELNICESVRMSVQLFNYVCELVKKDSTSQFALCVRVSEDAEVLKFKSLILNRSLETASATPGHVSGESISMRCLERGLED